VFLGLSLAGCNAIFGVDGLTADETDDEGPGGSTTQATTSTSSSGGGPTSCEPGETRDCYGGPSGTEGVGQCAAGIERCADDGSGFGPCEDAVVPTPENCETAEDESCDGYGGCGEVVWAHVYGGNNDDSAHALVVDPRGQIAAGSTTSSNFALDGMLYESSSFDAYVHWFDPQGKVGSHLRFSGGSDELIGGMVLDDGALFVVGHYRMQLTFGGETSTSTSGYDIFMVRVADDGTADWLKTIGGTGDQRLQGITADALGITVVGSFTGITNFGGGARDAGDSQACAIARFDAAGSYLWDVVSSASSGCRLDAVTTLADGTIVAGGSYTGPVTIAGVTLPGSFLSSGGVLLSFDPAGNLLGHRTLIGSNITVEALAADGVAVWAGGGFQGNVDFGAGNVPSQGIDAFVARYDSDLSTLELMLSAPDGGESRTHGLALAPDGDVLVAGHFVSALTIAGADLSGPGNAEAFVLRLSGDGQLRWAQSFGGQKGQIAERIATLPDNAVVVVGRFEEEIALDQPYVLFGGWNAWIAKLSP
jgi:hypothetical protein